MANEFAAAERRVAQAEPVSCWSPVGEISGRLQLLQKTGEAAFATEQCLQPGGKRPGAAGEAARCGNVQASGRKLPGFARVPVAGNEVAHRIVPDIRRLQRDAKRGRDFPLDEIVEAEALALQSRFDEAIAGVGV